MTISTPQNKEVKRRKRVNISGDTEVVVSNNVVGGRVIYENPRISTSIDMSNFGDEDYVTVKELRTMVNSHRKFFEEFNLLIVDILSDEYDLDDLLIYLGLDKKYEEYFEATADVAVRENPVHTDLCHFILESDNRVFTDRVEKMSDGLRYRVLDSCSKLIKLGKLTDYQKMMCLRKYVDDDILDDIEDSEMDIDADI